MAPNDIDRLRHEFSTIRVSDQIEATAPPTPTTPTSRMHLLSGLRTAPKEQGVAPKTRGFTHPNSNGVPNSCDYGTPSTSPRIVLSPNNNAEGQSYFPQRPRAHKYQHGRGSSVSSLQAPRTTFTDIRPDTPESQPETFDPQVYASLQQQYLELLATNQYLVQQAQQQQLALQHQYLAQQQLQQLAFLSPPRTPIQGHSPQYGYDSPTTGFLVPGAERHQFVSPRRSRFDQNTADGELSPPSDVPFQVPTPVTSPSPASSESSWRRGHRRGKSSISINGSAIRQLQPVRQPIGPPPMETLLAKKASGEQSPNFATRLRRKAVNRLMQAGLERKQTSPGPVGVPQFEFQDAQGKVTPESMAGSDEETDCRKRNIRRSALF